MRKSKGMNKAPKSIYITFKLYGTWDGLRGREPYGHGVLIVVVGVTPHQGDGNAVHRAKQDRKVKYPKSVNRSKRNATDDS